MDKDKITVSDRPPTEPIVVEETQQEQITTSKVPTSRRISVGGKNQQNGATERGIQATAINLPESQEWEPIRAS
jgi:hypothetical protein